MDVFDSLMFGFGHVFTGNRILFVFAGALLGTWVGMLPGIGPATGIALLLPFIQNLDSSSALIMLGGVYFGAMYGGAISSILINTPGDASAVMTALDGNPMARKGRAGAALFISAMASFIGGTLGLIGLTFMAVPLAEFALTFGPTEYFSLMLFALIATGSLIEGSPLKGLLSGIMGLMIATVGIDLQSASGRFTLGQPDLMDGISILIVIIGIFSVSEAFFNIERISGKTWAPQEIVGKLWATKAEWMRCRFALLRGTFIGFFVGLIPGAGGAVATPFAYAAEMRFSKHRDEFGKGAIEGVAAPESANNASVTGALIPMLTLGIPGSASTAIMLGALMIYGIQPGPQLFQEHPELTWGLIASLYVGNIVLLILNIPLIGMWVRLLKMPGEIITVLIMMLALTGAYTLQNNLFDVALVLLFGIVGYILRKFDFPIAPLILGVVLGQMMEQSLRQSLTLSGNDWMIFLTRPLSAVVLTLSLLTMFGPWMFKEMRKSIEKPVNSSIEPGE